jgi:hypothetical protein
MIIVLAVALLVLSAAIVVLFAMLGELASRLPAPGDQQRDTAVRPLEQARLGHVADSWPAVLAARHGIGQPSVLLVLSSACSSCADIAGQLTEDPGFGDWAEMAVVISTASRESGEHFVAQHGLNRFPHYIDEGGEWVSGEFGVRLSPSALVFAAGQLSAAYTFRDVAALRDMARRDQNLTEEPAKEAV